MQRLANTLGWSKWGVDKTEVADTLEDFTGFSKAIQRLPIATRELLCVIVDRSSPHYANHTELRALHHEIVQACEMRDQDVVKHVEIMAEYEIATGNEYDETPHICLINWNDWPIWSDLRKFCERSGVKLNELLVDLRFDLLD